MKKILIPFNLEIFLSQKKIIKKKNKSFFLLGEWCKNNQLINNNKNYGNYKILNFYKSNNYKKKKIDCKKIEKIYQNLLINLKNNLNEIHKKNYSKKYWEILIGRWLFIFIVDVYIQWQLAEKIKKKRFDKILYLNLDKKKFITNDTYHYHSSNRFGLNKLWAHYTFIQILKEINQDKKIFSLVKINNNFKDHYNSSNIEVSKVLYKSYNKKIILYKTYFAKKITFDFFKSNLFFNYFHTKKKIIYPHTSNQNLRKKFIKKFSASRNKFNNFIFKYAAQNIPKVFLENYKFLEENYSKLNWPKDVDFICSSYGHFYDEIFKIYTAKEVNKKAKLLIFQHGYAGIFADNDFYSTNFDTKISDKYFVWGEEKKLNYESFFYTKSVDNNKFFMNKNKNKLLIFLYWFADNPIYPLNGFINGAEISKKIFDSFNYFLKNTRVSISKIHLRILGKDMTNAIKFYFKNLQIEDLKKISLKKSLKNTNLCIHFFLGTPFFESILYNKPTILLYDKVLHINFDQNFLKMLKKLKKNNIIFEDLKYATKFINKNYDHIEKWWNSKNVQNIRKEFCLKYCKMYNSKIFYKKIKFFFKD